MKFGGSRFWRRSRPVEEVDHQKAVVLDDSIIAADRYFRNIVIYVLASFVLVVVPVVLVWMVLWLREGGSALTAFVMLPLAIRPDQGVTALALLTALVIALQVSVRAPSDGFDPASALGRQIVLEQGARIAGAMAFAPALGASGHAIEQRATPEGLETVMQASAIFAASLLVSALAADAALASSERFGSKLLTARENQVTRRLVARLAKRKEQVFYPSALILTSQTVVILVAGSALSGWLILRASVWPVVPSTLAWVTGLSLTATLLITALVIFTRIATQFGEYLLAIYLGAIGGVTTWGYWLLLGAFISASNRVAATPQGVVGAVLIVTVSLAQAWLLSGRFPTPRPSATVGYVLVTRALECRVRFRQRIHQAKSPSSGSVFTAVVVLLLCLALPPLGTVAAIKYAQQEGLGLRARTVSVGLAILGAILCAIAIIWIATPSIGQSPG